MTLYCKLGQDAIDITPDRRGKVYINILYVYEAQCKTNHFSKNDNGEHCEKD